MAQEFDESRPYTTAAALAQHRLVKVTTVATASANAIVNYAGAGDDSIGKTLAAAASGEQVSVMHRNSEGSVKLTAAGAISAGAKCYPTGSVGKVAATGTGPAVAVAIEPATADGDVIECRFLGAEAVDPESVANGASAGNTGALPILFFRTALTATAGTYAIATPTRAVRIVDWWIHSRDTTASNVKLKNGSTDVTANIAKGTSDALKVAGADVVAAQAVVSAGTAINVVTSGNASVDVFVLCVPVAS